MDQLVRILEQEASLLELAVFRVKGLELLLVADEHRFLPQAVDELEALAEDIGALETVRALRVEALAEGHGLQAEPSGDGEPGAGRGVDLSRLAEVASTDERAALRRVQQRLRDVVAQLEHEVHTSRTLAMTRVAEIRAVLERLSGLPSMRYGRDGIPALEHPPTRSVDRRL